MSDNLVVEAIEYYKEKFGSYPEIGASAPGRVNLIGEHTDYNDGYVLPFALPQKTIVVGSLCKTNSETTIYSSLKNLPPASFTIDSTLAKGEPFWANYVKGTIYQYLSELPKGFAFNAVIVSNVKVGSGLSSSAALEVAIATFLEALNGNMNSITKVQKALRCQKAEHTFADTPCGIMDQYVSTMGVKGNLLLIDCRSNEAKLIPFGGESTTNPVVLVTNSNVKHELSGSEYPERVSQCKFAVEALKKKFPDNKITALRDATMVQLEAIRDDIPSVVYRRAKHAINEDIRTLATVEALKLKDFKSVGKYMIESHASLNQDYEVSCPELDVLVDLALKVPGVYGSRMTGGGFGGCTVTLVDKQHVMTLKKYLNDEYSKLTKLQCECFVSEPSDGATIVDLKPYIQKMQGVTLDRKRWGWIDYIVPVVVIGVAMYVAINALTDVPSTEKKMK